MRKLRSKLKRAFKEAVIAILLLAALSFIQLGSQIPKHIYYWVGSAALIIFFLWVTYKFKRKSEKYTNEWGYVVLSHNNELEHRYIAKQILGRDLKQNEVVHHINGKKADNLLRNLCVMDRESHEHFHSWLSWKKTKTGKYPSFREQGRTLVEKYGGTLLMYFVHQKKIHSHDAKKVFVELRKERKRLAVEKSMPAYMIFDNKTLLAMAETMPDTHERMLEIRGVGPIKLQMYGGYFIAVIKKYKSDFNVDSKSKKDSA